MYACGEPDVLLTRLAIGPDGVFLYFDLALSSHCGFFRASVRLARSLREHQKLTRWSIDELVVLYTLQAGAPSCYGLRGTASWGLCGSTPVADKLSSLTSFAYDKKAVWRAMYYLREHTDFCNVVCMKRCCLSSCVLMGEESGL